MNIEDVVQSWTRRPFTVQAALLTHENLPTVAAWAKATIHVDVDGKTYLNLKVDKPANEYRRRAYIGNYIIASGPFFKIYTASSFHKSFHQ